MATRAALYPRAAGRHVEAIGQDIWFLGPSPDGKQVWKRSFPARDRDAEFHVTVTWDAAAGTAQVVYATAIVEGGVPTLPRRIRRDTRSFVRRLQAGRT
ncbi:MAG TPA: hypothetical protein VFA78_06720 [Chloroflexota bacterium]|nr:hypothetical protein [Chloroflexota bacterium]